jgi:hypothetical protein
MPTNEKDPFAEYAPEARTTGSAIGPVTPKPTETGKAKYGISKPRRVIVRGIVADDKGSDNKRD